MNSLISASEDNLQKPPTCTVGNGNYIPYGHYVYVELYFQI